MREQCKLLKLNKSIRYQHFFGTTAAMVKPELQFDIRALIGLEKDRLSTGILKLGYHSCSLQPYIQ